MGGRGTGGVRQSALRHDRFDRPAAPPVGPASAPAAGPAPDEIRDQLRRMLEHPAFEASERRKCFLGYIVEEVLAGRSDRLKGYAIATAVFGRDASFDSQTDPVVRLEAGRLRRALEHYYLTDGRDDPVRIEVPKGGYVPVFHRQPVAAATPGAPPAPDPPGQPPPGRYLRLRSRTARALLLSTTVAILLALGWLGSGWFDGPPAPGGNGPAEAPVESRPSVVVAPFTDLNNARGDFLAEAVPQELVSSLLRFEDLVVFDGRVSFQPAEESPLQLAERLDADYLVVGSVRRADQQIRISVELVKLATGATIWTGSYDAELTVDRLFALEDKIANSVAVALAQPDGVVHRDMRSQLRREPPHDLGAYQCLLQAYAYRRDFRPATHASVRACLEQAVTRDPDYADALAMLSMVYLDEFRWRFNPRPESNPLADALRMAEQAVETAPESAEAWLALFEARFFQSDLEQAFAAGERAIALNPNDPEILALVGLRKALAGQWDRGLGLVEQALAINPAPTPWYYFAVSMQAFRQGDDDEALRWAEKIKLPGVFWTHVLVAAINGQLGRKDEAREAVARLLALRPDFAQHGMIELGWHHLEPAVLHRVVEGLRKAGLEMPDSTAAASG
jgi:adenylate cyclase